MTTDQAGNTYTYDAWNRPVTSSVKSEKLSYTADGALFTDATTVSGTTTTVYLFHTPLGDQTLADDAITGSTRTFDTYVWGLSYVDDLVTRDRGSLGSATRLYVQQDASHNVTALLNASGSVQERFIYDPYGASTVLTSSWSTTTDSQNWVYNFKGGRYDVNTGTYYFRSRWYDPATGTWMSQDPAGYVNGANLYQAMLGAPISKVDPYGMDYTAIGYTGTPSGSSDGPARDTSYDNVTPNGLGGDFGPPDEFDPNNPPPGVYPGDFVPLPDSNQTAYVHFTPNPPQPPPAAPAKPPPASPPPVASAGLPPAAPAKPPWYESDTWLGDVMLWMLDGQYNPAPLAAHFAIGGAVNAAAQIGATPVQAAAWACSPFTPQARGFNAWSQVQSAINPFYKHAWNTFWYGPGYEPPKSGSGESGANPGNSPAAGPTTAPSAAAGTSFMDNLLVQRLLSTFDV